MNTWQQVPEPEPFRWSFSGNSYRVIVIPVPIGWAWIREELRPYSEWKHEWLFNYWGWYPTKRMAMWGGRLFIKQIQRKLKRDAQKVALSIPLTDKDLR